MDIKNLAAQLVIANHDKVKLAAELNLANIELDFQNKEKGKLAAELVIANIELDFQNEQKLARAHELMIANQELDFLNEERAKRAAELIIANKELVFQNSEKEKRAAELVIAYTQLDVQNREREIRVAELILANTELIFQNQEKEKRAAELAIAKTELLFQNEEKEKRAAEKIYPFIINAGNSIKRLEKLIEDLLDVTKINSGQIDLNIAAFHFSDALTNSIVNVQLTARRHEILLENSVDQLYSGDQFRIERVLINLLNNAIKYSPNDTLVIVNAKVDAGNIVVSVQDFGIGIAKEDIDQLFQRFYRVSKTAMNFQGVGLGLYIASEIIRKHSGSFSIESEPEKGSCFTFTLPLAQPVISNLD